MVVQQPNSGGGAVLGAIAGGVLGNQIGHGAAAQRPPAVGLRRRRPRWATASKARPRSVQNVQQCSTQTIYENRTVAYNVTYEYAGTEHTVQMPKDPGPTIRLELTPMAGAPRRRRPRLPTTARPAPRWVSSRAPTGAARDGAPPVAYTTYYPAAYPAYPYRHTRTRLMAYCAPATTIRRSACR